MEKFVIEGGLPLSGTMVPAGNKNSALPILGISEFWQQALVGLLIIAAIVLDRVLAARRARKLIEARDE